MEFFRKKTQFDFLGIRYWAAALSILLVTLSIAGVFVRGLHWSLDFTGGTVVELHAASAIDLAPVRAALTSAGFEDAVVQHYGGAQDILVRLALTSGAAIAASGTAETASTSGTAETASTSSTAETASNSAVAGATSVGQETSIASATTAEGQETSIASAVLAAVKTAVPDVDLRRVDVVGAQIGHELAEQGLLAFLVALLGTFIYVAVRFERRFAVGAALALLHDPILIVGVFSWFQLEFDLPTLAAILAVIGYSLNDTIVVFDRVKENFLKLRKGTPIEIMNISINQTLSRTLMTSFLTLLVVVALLVYGGASLHGFALALVIGIVVGTYSSIYIAGALAVALGLSRQDLLPPKKTEEEDRP